MSFDTQRLLDLLPTVYRVRDEAGAFGTRGALRALVDVIAGQVEVLEEDLAQLYDDQFIETCADWVAPYIGDLLGHRSLYGVTDRIGSLRAEVANTIAYRRRKGTASMLEQLARDVTGWECRVVECFQRLATTQYMNHVRRDHASWVAVREGASLARLGSPLETATHTVDVRRIARRRGRYNITNVAIHAWRIRDHRRIESPAAKLNDDPDDRRYFFNPLRSDAQLFNHTVPEDTITHIAERANLPMPITRRELWDDLQAFYPESVSVILDGRVLPARVVAASDLSDVGAAWAYPAVDRVLVDPVLGRLSLPPALVVEGHDVPMVKPVVAFSHGFSADLGGGPYSRIASFTDDLDAPQRVSTAAGLQTALGAIAGSAVIELEGNGCFEGAFTLRAPAGARIEVRAAENRCAHLLLKDELVIEFEEGAEVTLNGLLVSGAALRVPPISEAGRLRLRHCTLVPGLTLKTDGSGEHPGQPSLVVELPNVDVEIDRSIVGGLRVHEGASVRIGSTIVDAGAPTGVAYAAVDGAGPGGSLEIVTSTVFGKIHTRILTQVSNAILDARLLDADAWPHPVHAERRQEGCVRFSYVPPGSRVPRRHHCQPATEADAIRVRPQFTSVRYGHPAYAQLSRRSAAEIRTGADDESEMGAFHDLFAPQRETNLEIRLDEYLRFGLEAGIFYAS